MAGAGWRCRVTRASGQVWPGPHSQPSLLFPLLQPRVMLSAQALFSALIVCLRPVTICLVVKVLKALAISRCDLAAASFGLSSSEGLVLTGTSHYRNSSAFYRRVLPLLTTWFTEQPIEPFLPRSPSDYSNLK